LRTAVTFTVSPILKGEVHRRVSPYEETTEGCDSEVGLPPNLNAPGRRDPGAKSLSGQIELADLYLMSIEGALSRLLQGDPSKFAGIWEWLALAQNEAVPGASDRRTTPGNG